MARLFNVQVFNNNIGNASNTSYFSDSQYNDLMGQADSIAFEIICDAAPGNETVSVQYWHSNDNVNWTQVGSSFTLTVTAANGFPQSTIVNTMSLGTFTPGGFVRVQCKATSNASGVAVRVIACGRTQ